MGYNDFAGSHKLEDLPENEGGFDPLPAGWYDVLIVQAEDKQTKKGDGAYLNFRLDVEGPTHAGRVVYVIHLYEHGNEDAVRLGLAKLHALARAMGRTALPRDLMSWSGARVQAKLKVKPAKDGYEAGNDVVDYRARQGAALPPSAPEPSNSTQQMPNGDDIPF